MACLPLLASCDPPGGGGDQWSCATAFAGTAEGEFFEEPTEGTFTAVALLDTFDEALEDVGAAPGAEVWVLRGEYEEIEGPLPDDQKLRNFLAVINEDGTLSAVTEDEAGSDFALGGSIDIEGDCTAEGTWDFNGQGTWQARP